jgi:hypothetical protein
MFSPVDQLFAEEINIEDLYVIVREDPRAPQSTREYWSQSRTWLKNIEEARVYEDGELASNIRRIQAMKPDNFLRDGQLAVPTRFRHVTLGDLFNESPDAIALTQARRGDSSPVRDDFRYKALHGL